MNKKMERIIKLIGFVGMIIGSYYLTDKIVEYVSSVDIIIVKRVVNISLIVLISGFYFGKEPKDQKQNSKH